MGQVALWFEAHQSSLWMSGTYLGSCPGQVTADTERRFRECQHSPKPPLGHVPLAQKETFRSFAYIFYHSWTILERRDFERLAYILLQQVNVVKHFWEEIFSKTFLLMPEPPPKCKTVSHFREKIGLKAASKLVTLFCSLSWLAEGIYLELEDFLLTKNVL